MPPGSQEGAGPIRGTEALKYPTLELQRPAWKALPVISSRSSPQFTVLAVCTGNICRSPTVERLLGHALGPDAEVSVASAGVGAVIGASMAGSMATLVTGVGVSPHGFRARQLTERMVEDAGLVLALTLAHRSQVVDLVPTAVRRAFTLREFARFASAVGRAALPVGTPAERMAALVPLAAAQRGRHRTLAAEDDVVDPYGGNEALYALSFAQLRPAVETIAAIVRAVEPENATEGEVPRW